MNHRSVCQEISLRLSEADGKEPDESMTAAIAVAGGDMSQEGLLPALVYVLVQASSHSCYMRYSFNK